MKKEQKNIIKKEIENGESFIFISSGGAFISRGSRVDHMSLLATIIKGLIENNTLDKNLIKKVTELGMKNDDEIEEELKKIKSDSKKKKNLIKKILDEFFEDEDNE